MRVYDRSSTLGADEILCMKRGELYVQKLTHYARKCWLTRFVTRGRYDTTKILNVLNNYAHTSFKDKNWNKLEHLRNTYSIVILRAKKQNKTSYSPMRRFFFMKPRVKVRNHAANDRHYKLLLDLHTLESRYQKVAAQVDKLKSHRDKTEFAEALGTL